MEFSYFKKVSLSTKPIKKINLRELIKEIKNDIFLEKKIAQMRIHYKNKNKQKYDTLKKQLPCFTPAGTFLERKKEIGIDVYNQLTILDIDKLSIQKISLNKVKSKVISIPETFLGFVSPSGDGYKILVRINSDENTHEEATKQVINYYQEKLGIEIDGSGTDITRLCILSHDKEIYFNEKNRIFKIQTGDTMKNKLEKAFEITANSLEFKEGSRNNFIYLLGCNLNRFGISMAKALEFSISKYCLDDFSESEIEVTIRSAYSHKDEFGKWKKIKDAKTIDSEKLSKEEIANLEGEMGLDTLDFQHIDIAMLLIEEYDIEFHRFLN